MPIEKPMLDPQRTTSTASVSQIFERELPFNRLVPGVDNLRIDVYLSPELCRITRNVVWHAMAKYAQADELLSIKNPRATVKERDAFKRVCAEVLQGGIHAAKASEEIQIDFLCQSATMKMMIDTVRQQYGELVKNFQQRILAVEQAGQRDIKETIRLKERLNSIRENRSLIIRQVGMELFFHLGEINKDVVFPLRTASLGTTALWREEVYLNPLLHVPHPPEDDIMLELYVLIGRRLEDPDRYDVLLPLIHGLVEKALSLDHHISVPEGIGADDVDSEEISRILTQPGNIDLLFNSFFSLKALKRLKEEGGPKAEQEILKRNAKSQTRRLQFLFRRFRREGLLKRICAAYEIKPICSEYCPPLQPMQLLQFLTVRKSRRLIAGRLKAYRKTYGRNISLNTLRKKAGFLWRISRSQQQITLIQFLKDFLRYHRDMENYKWISGAMNRIHLMEGKNDLVLSRANKTLHEFLLPHEQTAPEDKPIIRHVILKADVRGATDLTHRMIERRLNPASFFSLNFFEPISNILPGYGAEKVFIEGDAVILSIMEREADPSNWYAVSRACGLAVQILMIIALYNTRSQQNELPVLEVGCGISYIDSPPAFLFDGDSRIMISPAINYADRMSGCTRALRGHKKMRNSIFNLRVLAAASVEEQLKTQDDICLRYNVNGIELNAAGFEKLSKEIQLRAFEYTLPGPKPIRTILYTGKFPTMTGQYQRLIIREARIPEVTTENLRFIRWSDRKYYEVCTHPELYEYIRSKSVD